MQYNSENVKKDLVSVISSMRDLKNNSDKELYKRGVYLAHELMSSWPESKKVRCLMSIGKRIGDEGFFSVNQSGSVNLRRAIHQGSSFGVSGFSNVILSYGLEEVLRENDNPDNDYPYYEAIKGAYIIELRSGKAVRCNVYMETGMGDFVQVSNPSEFMLFDSDSDSRAVEVVNNIFRAIDGLEGKKVFFFPAGIDSLGYNSSGELETGRAIKYDPLDKKGADILKLQFLTCPVLRV